MKKKVLALFLAVVMMITALPFNAFALSYGTQAELEEKTRTMGLAMYGLSSNSANYDADGDGKISSEEKYEEAKAVIKAGYVNQFFIAGDDYLETLVTLCLENDVDFWFSPGKYYSDRVTIETYINNAEYWVNKIRAVNVEVDGVTLNGYDNLLGFFWDEPIWGGLSSADLRTMTEALYKKWGKRNFIVETPYVFAKGWSNDDGVEAITDEALKYVTDVAWDNYAYDVRSYDEISELYGDDPFDKQYDQLMNTDTTLTEDVKVWPNYVKECEANGEEPDYDGDGYITGSDYYKFYSDVMIERFEDLEQDVYVWYYPSAYDAGCTKKAYTGLVVDEGYVDAHINFFSSLLTDYNNKYTYAKPGGLALYTYSDLSDHLPITVTYTDSEGNEAEGQLKTTENPEGSTDGLWTTVAKTLAGDSETAGLVATYSGTALSPLVNNINFGSLDVSDVDSSSITINAVAGYEYTINAGTYDAETGKFTGLQPETTYTITVTRTADSATATFDVTTTAVLPYASGMDDTASYILKMPSNLQHITTHYSWPSSTLSQNSTGNGWYVSASSGKRIDGGYISIVEEDGDYFLNFKLDNNYYEYTDDDGNVTTQDYTNSDGNASVNLSLGNIYRSSKDKGLDSSINTENLKYFAYRFKADAGSEGQVSKFDLYLSMTTDTGTYQKRTERAGNFDLMYLDKSTLALSKMTFEHGITLTEQAYDGWLIIPFDSYTDIDGLSTTSNLDNIVEYMTSYQLFMHHHTDAETYCSHVGGTATSWTDRTLKIGDVMVLEDVNAFVERKQSANVTTENEKNILTVPVDSPITFNPSAFLVDYRKLGNVYGYYWGITRYNNPNFMHYSTSQTIGGEQFFSYEVKEDTYNYKEKVNSDGTKTTASRWYTLFLPANYTLGVNFSATSSNTASYPSLSRGGVLYGEQTIATLYSDAADYNYVAFRLKTEGGKDGETSPVGIHIGTSVNPIDLTGTAVINYNDGTTTTIESGTQIDVPSNFDGWIVVPSTSIATATRAGFVFLKDDNYSWYGKTIYHGNIKIVKDLDIFKSAHGIPEFDVTATNTSITVTCDAENARFSLDELNWYSADAFNTMLAETEITVGSEYTVYSKNAGAVYAAIGETSVWTIDDTAKSILTVPAAGGAIYYNNAGNDGKIWGLYWGLTRWTTSEATDSDKDGNYDTGASFNYQKSNDVNGEYLFKAVVYSDGTYQQNFLPATYMLGVNYNASADNTVEGGSYEGQLYGSQPISALYDDAADYNYIAVRQKIVRDTETTINYHVGTGSASGAMCSFANVVLINYTDGTQTTITSTSTAKSYTLPANFDGWIIIPKENFYSSIAMADVTVVGIRYSNLVAGDSVYTGDIKIIEDDEAFVQVHFTPDFEVTSGATSLTVSSDAVASENVVYSLDKATWLTADAFNAAYGVDNALDYDAKYTVYAKYESASVDSIVAKTVWTAPYSTHNGDGGSYFLNVYDDAEANPMLATNYVSGGTSYLFKDADGVYGTLSSTRGLHIKNINGETFIEMDKKAYKDETETTLVEDVNFNVNYDYITYGENITGIHSSVDTTNLTHMAVRLKLENDEGVDVTDPSIFSMYMNYSYTCENGNTHSYQTRETDLENAYFITTSGDIIDPNWDGYGFKFTDEFDGWVVFPLDAYDYTRQNTVTVDGVTQNCCKPTITGKEMWLENIGHIQMWLHDTGCGHGCSSSRWASRTLYFGDMIALEGTDKFNAAHTKPDFELDADNTSITITDEYEDGMVLYSTDKETWFTKSEFNSATKRTSFVENTVSAIFANAADKSLITSKTIWTMTDSATNILEVPEAGAKIGVDDWYYKNDALRYSTPSLLRNSTNSSFASGDLTGYLFSETIDGENYFKVDFSNEALESATTTKYYQLNFIPINYYNGSNVTGYLDSSTATNKYYDRTMFSEYYSGTEDANYMAFRIRMTGGDENDASQVSKMSICLRAATVVDETVRTLAGATDVSQNGAVIINYTDNTITEITTSTEYIEMPSDFDGWILVTKNSINGGDGTFGSVAVPSFYFAHNATTSTNWRDRNLYVGDMMLVEDLESFKRVYYHPEFEVEAKGNNFNVTNETDTVKSALYSVDGSNWLDIDAFNKVERELFTEYTVYAKYPNAQAKNIVSETLWIRDDSVVMFSANDDADGKLYYSGYTYGINGLGYTQTGLLKTSDGKTYTTGDGSAYLFADEIDGENMWKIDFNVDEDGNLVRTSGGGTYIYPFYSSLKENGVALADADVECLADNYTDADEYTHLAIRVKFVDDGTGNAVADATHSFSLNLLSASGKDSSYGGWADHGGVYFIDINTGEKTVVDKASMDLKLGFDGYVVYPADAVRHSSGYGTLADLVKVHIFTHWNCSHSNVAKATDNWAGTELYIGDMNIVKDLDAFMLTVRPLEFEAALSDDRTNLVVTNEADTEKRALYSIDGVSWFDIDTIQTITLEDDYLYTVQAKYPWSDEITSTQIDTAAPTPYSTGLNDGASYFMNVYDDIEAHPYLAYTTALSITGVREMGEPSASATLCKDSEGVHTGTQSTARLFLREFTDARGNTETFIELDKNESYANCVNQSIYPDAITYGARSSAGLDASIDRTNLNYLAIRLKIEDNNEADITSGFYLYINGKNMPRKGLMNAIVIDNATGTVSGAPASWQKWNSQDFIFTGDFDGWVIVPMEESYTKDTLVNGTSSGQLAVQPYMHRAYETLEDGTTATCHDAKSHALQGWDNKTLYLGDILVLEDDDLFIKTRYCDNGLHNLEDVAAVAATTTTNGTVAHKHCTVCGANFDAETGTTELDTIIETYADVVFRSASLTLDNSTAVNFKTAAMDTETYTKVYAEFALEGVDEPVKVDTYTVDDNGTAEDTSDDMWIFTFDDIPAEMMGNTITATLYATGVADSKQYTSSIEYSVKQYCYNKLEKYADDESDYAVAFKELIVDLLYYGSAVQTYTGTNADNLVKDDLTREQKALASAQIPEMNGMRAIYNNLTDGETTKWKSGNVSFQHNVQLKFNFTINDTDENISNYKLVFSSDPNAIDTGYEIEYSEFVVGKSDYAVYFDGFNATEMDSNIYVTVYNGDTQVSDTLVYSISSYARQKYTPDDPANVLSNVVLAMMRYGDAAEAFAPLNV